MKKTLYILIGLLIAHKFAFAQVDETTDYVYFFSDAVDYGNVEYKTPFIGAAYLTFNSHKVPMAKVKFYKNETGFFANTMYINFWQTPTFTERIRKGKINLYEKVNINSSPGHYNAATGFYTGGTSSKTILNYYNIGFEDLKKANYKNLSLDLADNPESLMHLAKYKSLTNTQTGLYIAGGAAILVGIITLVNKTSGVDYDTEPSPDVTANLVTIGAGAVLCTVSYFISLSKPEKLRKAVDVYNR